MITGIQRIPRSAAMVGALLLLAAGELAGQEPELLEVGRSTTSELTASLPRFAGTPSRTFRFDARAGRRYEVAVTSSSFAPEVRVGRNVTGVTDYLAMATDQGLGGGVLLEVDAPATETLLVLVRAAEDGAGPFTLMVREATPGEVRPLVLSRPGSGFVGASAESLHSFAARAGEELEITVRSTEFDTYLEIGRITAGEFTALETDDDGAGGTDSRVYFTAPSAGEYLARVTAYGGVEGGSYAITLTPPVELPEPRRLTLDVPATGRLGDGSPSLNDGIPFEDWVISARRGDRVRLDARSEEFDTYLVIGRMEGRRLLEMSSNDDWSGPDLGDTDSRVVLIAREDGDYVARVRSYSSDEEGTYTILATALEPARMEPLGGTISPGETVSGTLSDTDAVLDDGVIFQEWRLSVSSPGRYEISLSSGDFDTYLILGRELGGEFEEIASNDDWTEGPNRSDSRIVINLPEAGEYILRVRPFLEGTAGDYDLSVRQAAPLRSDPAGGVIQRGQTVTGELVEEDARIDDSPYHEWRVALASGERVIVALESTDFDAYLSVGRRTDSGFMELADDDDSGGDTNARLEFVAPSAGDYLIRVRPFYGDATGEYSLSVGSTP